MTFKSIIEHLAQKETFALKENLALKEHVALKRAIGQKRTICTQIDGQHYEPARRTTDQI